MDYTLQVAEKHIAEALKQLQLGNTNTEGALRQVVVVTLQEWLRHAKLANKCCGCNYDGHAEVALPNLISAINSKLEVTATR